jgi:hypothetical protein
MFTTTVKHNGILKTLEGRFDPAPLTSEQTPSIEWIGVRCIIYDVTETPAGVSLIGGLGWGADYDEARQRALGEALRLIAPTYRTPAIKGAIWLGYLAEYGLRSDLMF